MNRPLSFSLRVLPLLALLSVSACQTVARRAVAGAVEAITGQEVDAYDAGAGGGHTPDAQALLDDRETKTATTASVYQAGPTPGWERGFRARASVGSAYYQNGLCMSLPSPFDFRTLWSRQADPFGPIDRAGNDFLVETNSQGIDPGYLEFGEVRLGGPSPTGELWQSLDFPGMHGMAGTSCPLFGMFSFGANSGAALALK